jgi:acetyl-CoA carboxylase carboxyl transferase subunit alpha
MAQEQRKEGADAGARSDGSADVAVPGADAGHEAAGGGVARRGNSRAAMPFERTIHEMEAKLAEVREAARNTTYDVSEEIETLEAQLQDLIAKTYSRLTAWERVNVARHPDRPVTADYIATMRDEFTELHGDRSFGDDRAMVTGLARMGDHRFMLVAHRKGRTTKERLQCNFGCAHPEGYRKAWRKMKLAEKLRLPIVTLVNTPGAYPGIGAEERGQALAIAENIIGMFALRVPILVCVIGEGGSGGALGIGVGDRVLMLQHAYYSVISPEGCAAILWKSGERSADAAEALKLTSDDLTGLGIVDEIVEEPLGGAHRDPAGAIRNVRAALTRHLAELVQVPVDELVAARREKFSNIAALEGRFPTVAV